MPLRQSSTRARRASRSWWLGPRQTHHNSERVQLKPTNLESVDEEDGEYSPRAAPACGRLWMQDRRRDFLAFYANPRMKSGSGHNLDHLVSIGAEMRSVMGAISPFQLQVVPGTTFAVFEQALREHRPRVMSVTTHGVASTGAMAFENDAGYLHLVPPEMICSAIERALGKDADANMDSEPSSLSLLIVSTCNGRKLAEAVVKRRPSMAVVFWDSVVEDALSKDFSVAMHVCVSRELQPHIDHHANARSHSARALKEAGARYGGGAAFVSASLPRDDFRLRAFARALRRFSRMTYCDRTPGHRKSAHPCMGKAVIMFSDGAYRFARGESNLLRAYDVEGADDSVEEEVGRTTHQGKTAAVSDVGHLVASIGGIDLEGRRHAVTHEVA